jgi:hypothetical protein
MVCTKGKELIGELFLQVAENNLQRLLDCLVQLHIIDLIQVKLLGLLVVVFMNGTDFLKVFEVMLLCSTLLQLASDSETIHMILSLLKSKQ